MRLNIAKKKLRRAILGDLPHGQTPLTSTIFKAAGQQHETRIDVLNAVRVQQKWAEFPELRRLVSECVGIAGKAATAFKDLSDNRQTPPGAQSPPSRVKATVRDRNPTTATAECGSPPATPSGASGGGGEGLVDISSTAITNALNAVESFRARSKRHMANVTANHVDIRDLLTFGGCTVSAYGPDALMAGDGYTTTATADTTVAAAVLLPQHHMPPTTTTAAAAASSSSGGGDGSGADSWCDDNISGVVVQSRISAPTEELELFCTSPPHSDSPDPPGSPLVVGHAERARCGSEVSKTHDTADTKHAMDVCTSPSTTPCSSPPPPRLGLEPLSIFSRSSSAAAVLPTNESDSAGGDDAGRAALGLLSISDMIENDRLVLGDKEAALLPEAEKAETQRFMELLTTTALGQTDVLGLTVDPRREALCRINARKQKLAAAQSRCLRLQEYERIACEVNLLDRCQGVEKLIEAETLKLEAANREYANLRDRMSRLRQQCAISAKYIEAVINDAAKPTDDGHMGTVEEGEDDDDDDEVIIMATPSPTTTSLAVSEVLPPPPPQQRKQQQDQGGTGGESVVPA